MIAKAARRWLDQPASPAGAAFAVGALAFLPAAAYVLNHFYDRGPGYDSWTLAAIVWRNPASLPMPLALTGVTASFFATHWSPILLVPALLSRLVPLAMVPWFALWTGTTYALLALAAYRALIRDLALATRGGVALAALLALGFAFGGGAMTALILPHYEILIPAFGLLFLAALARGDRAEAWVWFILALAVREDAGFHLLGILLLAQLACPRRGVWVFVVLSFAASVAALAAIAVLFPWTSNFARIYLGTPPFAHLSAELVADRLAIFWAERSYVWLPALVTASWAALAREPLLLVGFAASLPWLALHLVAAGASAGALDLYYAFPFLFGVAWPAIALRWRGAAAIAGAPIGGGPIAGGARGRALIGQTAVVLAALVGWTGQGLVVYPLAMDLAPAPGLLHAGAYERFRGRLAAGLPELGTVRASYAAIGLLPDVWTPANWLAADVRPDPEQSIDSVIWHDPGHDDSLAWELWLTRRLANHFEVVGTSIVIATNRRLDQLPTLAPSLAPTDLVQRRMRPTAIARSTQDGLRVARDQPPGLIADGPHIEWHYGLYRANGVSIPAGRYEARFALRVDNARDAAAAAVRLEVGFADGPTVAAALVRADPQSVTVAIPFAVAPTNAADWLQLRAIHLGNADVTLRATTLRRTD